MKKLGILLAIFLISIIGLSMSSCTSNSMAKNYGGSMTVELEPGQALVEATWKNDDLWLLTRPRKADEAIETFKFKEVSSFGVWEGTITIKEK